MRHVPCHVAVRPRDPHEVVVKSFFFRKLGQFDGSSFRNELPVERVEKIVHRPDAVARPFPQEHLKILIRVYDCSQAHIRVDSFLLTSNIFCTK